MSVVRPILPGNQRFQGVPFIAIHLWFRVRLHEDSCTDPGGYGR